MQTIITLLIFAGAYPTLRKVAITPKVKSKTSWALTIQIQLFKIISSFCIFNPITGVDFDDLADLVIFNILFRF